MAAALPRNRLGLAQWLFAEDQPLTARVAVNRMWQEIFGVGLVRTADDFGSQGEPPSNPQLLDWLAVDFEQSGWDIKRFYRQMLTSAAYRQMALATPQKLAKDPENRLLSRGPRFRMDAEMLRDYALAASGLLAPQIGGPSVKPYQPDGIWESVAMLGSNTRFYKQDSGSGLYRRSLYTLWKRAAPPAAHGDSQRAHARKLHRSPRAHRYAAASAGHHERRAVCGSRAHAGRRRHGKRNRLSPSAWAIFRRAF